MAKRIFATLALFLIFFYSSFALAYPGTLATTPLAATSIAEPNLMLLIDNSGSMQNIVPESPFNASTDGLVCPAANLLSNAYEADIQIFALTGSAYFTYNGTSYDWGNNGNANALGITGKKIRCFDPNQVYSATLYADAGNSSIYSPSGYLPAYYQGNYLNWYFGNAPVWGFGARKKPNQNRRMDIAQSTTTSFINSLSSVRVGLATYNGTQGANILVGVDDVANNLTSLQTQIAGLTPSGMTPLAESLRDIGRYFVQGHNNSLTLHPGQANQQSVPAYSVFDQVPLYASGVVQQSPIQYWCQKNFTMIVTDGQSQGDLTMNNYLADYDGDCVNANPPCGQYERQPGRTYQSQGSDYLDDVADALHEINLRPDLKDSNGNSVTINMVTYTIGFADIQVMNDPLLTETAQLGGGLFLMATDTTSLSQALQTSFVDLISQIGSNSPVTFNSSNLNANSAAYIAQYDATRWSGDLMRYALLANGQLGNKTWDANTLLDAVSPNNRVIITYNKDLSQGVPFRTLSSLSAAQQADLNYGGNASLGQARLNYLRGDRSQEGVGTTYNLRVRNHVLGDIVDASPIYVGVPASPWPDTSPFPSSSGNVYSQFKKANQSRTPVVYIGANDGMLHAFQADGSSSGGQELLAYVPHQIASTTANAGMHYLTNPSYTHLFYVDETPAVADAFVKTTPTGAAAWHTVLVGNLGRGGRGIYALDITNPAQFSESNANNIVMWEFTNAVDNDLGYTLSDATIALMNDGRWAAIVGNGYNNTGTGQAKLYIIYLDGGLNGTWVNGIDYRVITTKVGTAAQPNGLSSPAVVDIDGNGTADLIYAGDLYGNMWVFDVSASDGNHWAPAYGSTGAPKPLFTATDNAGNVQPITAKPLLAINPSVTQAKNNSPDLLVLFGTGEYLTANDISSTNTQSLYAVWDDGTNAQLTRSNLVAQTMTTQNSTYRSVSSNTVSYTTKGSGATFGWYIDLTAGERIVSPVRVRNYVVFANTIIPNNTPCGSGGTGWLMSVNLADGSNPTFAVFDTNGDGQVNDSDKVNSVYLAGQLITTGLPTASTFRGNQQYTMTTSGLLNTRTLNKILSAKSGRTSWREIRRS